jgi:hypothetical protein
MCCRVGADTLACQSGPAVPHAEPGLLQTDRHAQHTGHTSIGVAVAGSERRHVDRISNRLVTGGVDHVSQCLLGSLDAASLTVPVPHQDQLLQNVIQPYIRVFVVLS